MAAPDPAASLERLKQTRRELVALLGTASAERLRQAPAQDEWAPATIVSHLADAELVYSVRLRMTLTSDRPYLAAYDEAAWVRRFAELEPDAREALARWRTLRDANVRLLESLEDDEWKLSGLHAERGELSVAHIADAMAKHDREHTAQIRAGLADD